MRVSFVLSSFGAALAALVTLTPTDSSGALSSRSAVPGDYVLYVDGLAGGYVKEISGGGVTSDVVTERLGQDHIQKKHLSGVKYEDISLVVSYPSKPLADWIKTAIAPGTPNKKSGAFTVTDANLKELSRTTWTNGIISEVVFPELDASSKEPVSLGVTITPEIMRAGVSTGKVEAGVSKTPAKSAIASSFRLTLPGIDTSRVTHIDALSFKNKVTPNPSPDMRSYTLVPTSQEVPNLVFVIPEASASSLVRWQDDFIVKGQNTDTMEKTATIEVLGANLKDVVYRITLNHVGLFKLSPDSSSSGSVRKLRAELYAESASVEFP